MVNYLKIEFIFCLIVCDNVRMVSSLINNFSAGSAGVQGEILYFVNYILVIFRSDKVRMVSPVIKSVSASGRGGSDGNNLCFSFWFAAFGAGESTTLKVYK